ncbi:MAG: hypothetical protein JWN52_339 [Actinomycetia bacterium]|nr:hypothetical protein [Actinomycetes bacterium]
MPFTEQELRAVLEDNSAEVPPVSDLTGNAERQGRKIRRRRYAAGAVAATCALAAGVITLPGLVDNSGLAKPVAASGSRSVSPSPQPVHVDASVLTGAGEDRLIAQYLKMLSALTAQARPLSPVALKPGVVSAPSVMAAFADVVVTGTVEGFTAGQIQLSPPGAAPTKALKSVVMQVRVDKTIKGSAPGARVYVRVGSGSEADPQKFQTAIPAGARLVAFLDQVRSPLGDGGDRTGHPGGTPLMDQQQGLVFEDAGATGTKLVGGPYYQGKYLGKPWTDATTIDQLATLLQTVKDDCTRLEERLTELKAKLGGKTGPGALALERVRCAKLAAVRHRFPGATPTLSP